jgi:fructose-1,6-bisphosphatase/sedoheptulose 1,7-bisphosphatase-like protein
MNELRLLEALDDIREGDLVTERQAAALELLARLADDAPEGVVTAASVRAMLDQVRNPPDPIWTDV